MRFLTINLMKKPDHIYFIKVSCGNGITELRAWARFLGSLESTFTPFFSTSRSFGTHTKLLVLICSNWWFTVFPHLLGGIMMCYRFRFPVINLEWMVIWPING